jgi:hypothetical protein
MSEALIIKENYRLAECCRPGPKQKIVGFLKADSPVISVHRADCASLSKVDKDRLIALSWDEVIATEAEPDPACNEDYVRLDEIDFKILKHHQTLGIDYAAVVARATGLNRATVFERHRKLRDLKLLKRVQPTMIRYRKGVVDNKWIKHRNHTYFEITPRGTTFLNRFENRQSGG